MANFMSVAFGGITAVVLSGMGMGGLTMRLGDLDALKREVQSMNNNLSGVIMLIDEAPTIEAVPVRHARWNRGQCTGCKTINPVYKKDWNGDYIFQETPYCPECGARMDGE